MVASSKKPTSGSLIGEARIGDINELPLAEDIARYIRNDEQLKGILESHFNLQMKGVKLVECEGDKFYSLLVDGPCDATDMCKHYEQALREKETGVANVNRLRIEKLRNRIAELLEEIQSKMISREGSFVSLPVALCNQNGDAEQKERYFGFLALVESDGSTEDKYVNLSERISKYSEYGQRELFLALFHRTTADQTGVIKCLKAYFITPKDGAALINPNNPTRSNFKSDTGSRDKNVIVQQEIITRALQLKIYATWSAISAVFFLAIGTIASSISIASLALPNFTFGGVISGWVSVLSIVGLVTGILLAVLARECVRYIRQSINLIDEYCL